MRRLGELVTLALLLAGCEAVHFSAASSRPDTGARPDAAARPDASAEVRDAGEPDAGGPGPDAARPDAEAQGTDATEPGLDAAAASPDAADPPGLDAAEPGLDAAEPGVDATLAGPDAAAPGADAGAEPDAGEPAGCGKFELLADDFEDGVANPTLWVRRFLASGASVVEASGVVTFAPKANQNGSLYSHYGSTYWYDLTGSQIAFDIPEVTNTATSASTFFKLGDNQAGLEMTEFLGTLHCRSWVAGAIVEHGTAAYDPLAHRHWRLREAAGTVFFEAGSDGAAWTTLASAATPAFVADTTLTFGAGTYERVNNPGQARFASVNGGVPRGRGCPAALFTDAFTGTSIGPGWGNSYTFGGGTYSQADSAVLVPGTAGPTEAGFGSSRLFDLTASSVSAAVPEMVAIAPTVWLAFTLVEPDTGNKLEFIQENGTLYAKQKVNGTATNLATAVYDPAAHAAWRIREQGGVLLWETRGPGGWSPLHSAPAPFPPDALGVYLIAGASTATASPGRARYDDLNLVP